MRKINSFDLTKFILSIIVIAIHTKPWIGHMESFAADRLDLFLNQMIPLFFLICGYLLFYRIDDAYDRKSLTVVRGAVIRFVKLYFLWTLVYLIPAIYYYASDAGMTPLGALFDYLKLLLIGGAHYYSWQLWYLLSSVYGFLYIWICLKKRMRSWVIISISLCIGAFFFLNTEELTSRLLSSGHIWLNAAGNFLLLFQAYHDCLKGIIFLPLGMIIALRGGGTLKTGSGNGQDQKRTESEIRSLLGLSFLSAAAFFATRSFFVGILLDVFLFLLLLQIRLPDSGIWAGLRRYSSVAFYTHMWFVFLLRLYYGSGEDMPGDKCFVLTVLGTLVLFLISELYKQWKAKHSAVLL